VAESASSETEEDDVRAAIEDLIVRYAWAYDELEFESLGELFVEDATFEMSAPGVAPARGREAIVSFLHAARAGRAARGEQPRHLVNNLRVVEVSEGVAHVVSYMTLVVTTPDGRAVVDCAGTYHDRLVEVDGAWMFAARQLTFDRHLGLQPSATTAAP
jgi:3-phenylpropionate/cinnamic acid dioxygenase small subunit